MDLKNLKQKWCNCKITNLKYEIVTISTQYYRFKNRTLRINCYQSRRKNVKSYLKKICKIININL